MSKHTPGPWRWELNKKHKHLQLVGGKPTYDLTIIRPDRWGMHSATLEIRDTAYDGMNIMHKLHDRQDWITPHKNRSHHADWCANVIHPDMRLIASAPDLLAALESIWQWMEGQADAQSKGGHATFDLMMLREQRDIARAAIDKATGEV